MLIELKNRILIARAMVARVVAGEIDTGENIFGGVSKCRVFNGIETPVGPVVVGSLSRIYERHSLTYWEHSTPELRHTTQLPMV